MPSSKVSCRLYIHIGQEQISLGSLSLAQYEEQRNKGPMFPVHSVDSGKQIPQLMMSEFEMIKNKLRDLEEAKARADVVAAVEVKMIADLEKVKSQLEKEVARQNSLLQEIADKMEKREAMEQELANIDAEYE